MAETVRARRSHRPSSRVPAAKYGRSLVVVPGGRIAFDTRLRSGHTQAGSETIVVSTRCSERRTDRSFFRDRHQVLGLFHESYQLGCKGDVFERSGHSHSQKSQTHSHSLSGTTDSTGFLFLSVLLQSEI